MNSSLVNRDAPFAKHTIVTRSTDQRTLCLPFSRFRLHPSRITEFR